MMKKALLIALCVTALTLTGCGQKDTPDTAVNTVAAAAPTQTVQPVQIESPTTAPAVSEATEAPAVESSVTEIDLTNISSTMVYSYVFNMLSTPDDFIGQRFRIQGIYDEGLWEPTNQMYHYIIIADATACCAQGLEFVLADENAAYPQPRDEIEISGVFSTYEEDGELYVQIIADSLKKI